MTTKKTNHRESFVLKGQRHQRVASRRWGSGGALAFLACFCAVNTF